MTERMHTMLDVQSPKTHVGPLETELIIVGAPQAEHTLVRHYILHYISYKTSPFISFNP